MALDAYSPCPGGTGKKIKFCCSDLPAELEKIDRMMEGEQFIATIQHIDNLESKGTFRACLMATKSELLRATNQIDATKTYVADFLRRFPDNPVAWAESAMLTAMTVGLDEALVSLNHAIELCEGHIQSRIYEAAELIATVLLEDGRFAPARALLQFLNALDPEDRQVLERLLYFNRSSNVPQLLKDEAGMTPCPPDAPYRAKFEAAMEPMKRAAWRQAVERLAALAAEAPGAPPVWRNLGNVRSWLGDDKGAREALERYAALDVPLEDAVEAEATGLLLSQFPLGDEIDVLRWVWTSGDPERLQERLLSDGRVLPLPIDTSNWPAETPPPRTSGLLLDRPALPAGAELSRDSLPRTFAQFLLFGRQTDRAARLEIIGVARSDADAAAAVLREIGGDALDPAPEETAMNKTSDINELLGRRWLPPQGAAPEAVDAILSEAFRESLFNRVPDMSLGSLGGHTLRQLAAYAKTGEKRATIKALAAVLVLQEWAPHPRGGFDFNELRSHLGLPTLGPIDPRTCDLLRLPLVRLGRLDVEALDDEGLVNVFHRAALYGAREAVRKFAQAIIARPGLASRPERVEAYRALVESARSVGEGLKIIDEARGIAVSAGQSCALWDLMELSLRFGQGNAPEAMRLMQHIESRHINEPGVAQSLTRMLINAGLLNPDGTPAEMPRGVPAGAEPLPPAAEPSKLWTPGSETAGGGKLWTPG